MYLPIYQSINQSIDQFSSGPPVIVSSHHSCRFTASSDVQFPFHITRSTSISHTSLPVVHAFVLHPLTRSLFPQTIFHSPCPLTVHIISTHYSPFCIKFCCSHFSSNYVISYFQTLQVLAVFLQSAIPVLNYIFFYLQSNV